jgi:hypothetical protein
VASVQFHTIDRVHTFSEYTLSRERLFAGQTGGLRAVGPEDRSFITFSAKGEDLFEQGRRASPGDPTLNGCDNCHNSRYRPALESILSVQAILKPESLVDTRHPRWAQWYPASLAAASAKASRVEWGVLLGIWQSVPR